VSDRGKAFTRLFAVQAAWNYERMLGIGMGYAAEPLLAGLKATDSERHAEAAGRSAEFFNCHPYLAGLALGASVAAEYAGQPEEKIRRLKTALCGTLGALGDHLFWAGLLPALMGLSLIVAVLWGPWWGVGLFLVGYNGCRIAVGWWGLRTGLDTGMRVGQALASSWVPWVRRWVGASAGFLVGAAIPVAGKFLLGGLGQSHVLMGVGAAVVGLALAYRFRATFGGVRYGLLVVALVLLWFGVMP
jgi:mannose/fructose/N-acetylgalactosamine-specific phosphotransferase system component IID